MNVFAVMLKREHPIGEKVIRQTWRRYRDFIIHEEIMAAKAKSISSRH